MRPVFSEKAWEQLKDWRPNQRAMRKIYSLIDDILENGALRGIDKPELLRHYDVPTYSRRIDQSNRLVYEYDQDAGLVTILTCKGHYDEP